MVSSTLDAAARAFADELTATVQGVLGVDTGRFVAVRAPRTRDHGRSTRVVVRTAYNKALPLTIAGAPALELIADFRCKWDHRGTYLAVHQASWAVRPVDIGEPLFRYEFEAGMTSRLPSAHLHVHGHRDEFVFQMFRGATGRPRSRASNVAGGSGALPRLSNLHFPLGGPRMRPCLEDLLDFIIEEFRIDTAPGYKQVLDEGRKRWRRRQIGASVRDAPAVAAAVLQELGYVVTPPGGTHLQERTEKLSAP